MSKKILIVLIAAVILLAMGVRWYYRSKTKIPFVSATVSQPPETQTATLPGSCDIAMVDFSDRQVETSQFGILNFKNGTYMQNDTLGNPEWIYALSSSSSFYSFGSSTVRVINISADHLGGSGEWQLAVGYMCSRNKIQVAIEKVFEQFSVVPVLISQSGNTLSLTAWKTYEGTSPPQGKTTVQFKWLGGWLSSTQRDGCPCWDGIDDVCLPQTACE